MTCVVAAGDWARVEAAQSRLITRMSKTATTLRALDLSLLMAVGSSNCSDDVMQAGRESQGFVWGGEDFVV